MISKENLSKLRSVFAVNFILTISLALTSYIDSSFVETFLKKEMVGILFTMSSFGTLVYLSKLPTILEKFGVLRTIKNTSIVYIISVALLVSIKNPIILGPIFIIYYISAVALFLTIDVLVQHYSHKETVGNTRGLNLTIYNLAFLIAPFLAGIMANKTGFNGVYLLSGIFIAIMSYYFIHKFKDLELYPPKNGNNFIKNFFELIKIKDLRNVYLVTFTLNFFFAWMTIYMPIYLHDIVGFSWQEIGAIFAIMHIPYVLLEIPWGKIADQILGEKEIMAGGIIILGICTIAIGFIEGSEFWIWASALSLTRIGASMLQVTTESYFFKKIESTDTNKISVFRNASPIAMLIGPALATIILTLANIQELFIILGVLVLFALIPNYKLNDTK
jgi:MFS family permease